jgi:hypothetical protein
MSSPLRRVVASLLAGAVASTATAAGAQTRETCIPALEEGQTLRDQLKLRAARDKFILCARDACAAALRKDCAEALEAVTRDLPTLAVGARDEAGHDLPEVRVFVDGEPVAVEQGRSVPVDPGQHVVRVEHATYPPVSERIVLRMGERNRAVVVTLRPPATPATPPPPRAPPAGPPPLAYGLAAVGLVGLGSFAFFAITGKNEHDRLAGQCAPACSDADVSGVRTRYIVADLSLLVGVVAAGIATYLFVTPPRATPTSP